MSPAAVFEQFTRLPTLATAGMLALLTGSVASAQITRTGTPLGTPIAAPTRETLSGSTLTPMTASAGPPPTGLTVTASGILTGQVGWQPVADAASYSVTRWLQSDPNCCRASSPSLSGTSWNDAGLQWPGTYVYRVYVNYTDGRQGYADVSFTRPTPQDPTGFGAKVLGPGGVTLSWAPVPGVTTYLVGGPGTGQYGSEVAGTSVTLDGVPPGRQQWTVASKYSPGGLLTEGKLWPTTSAEMPYFGYVRSTVWYENGAMVDFDFAVSREATNLRLFRTQGADPAATEIPAPASYTRQPLGSADRVFMRLVFQDMQPESQYRFYFTADIPNAGNRASEFTNVSIPLFALRTTVPPSGDRVIVEWNPFGGTPYTLQKGSAMQQAGSTYIAYDHIRDASGNPMNFTGLLRYEDLTVQKGVRYHYKVCAAIPNGNACPVTSVTVP